MYFGFNTMIKNCPKCFILHLARRSIQVLLAVFMTKQCWTPASWNHATCGHINLTKSGHKFGLTHLTFILYMQVVQFYIRSRCLWLCLWLLLQCVEVNNFFAESRTLELRITNSPEEKCDHCMFKKMHITTLFFISLSWDLLYYKEQASIYLQPTSYILDKFWLWKREKVTSCRVTFFHHWHFLLSKRSSFCWWLSIK